MNVKTLIHCLNGYDQNLDVLMFDETHDRWIAIDNISLKTDKYGQFLGLSTLF